MNEHRTKFGDYFKVKHGYAFKSEFFSDAGNYVVVTPGNFFDEGGFKRKGDKEKFYTGTVPDGFVLKRGDLIVAMTEQAEGLLGSSALIPENNYYLHNQRLGLITDLDENKLDKKFLYYLFNFRDVRNQIRATATGTKIRHTAPERILGVRFKYLSIKVQRSIAEILSAYDDLIENNVRRIQVLEEMTRRMYEEWFLRFRFPGHENVRMVESELGLIPDEWEVKRLGDVCVSLIDGDWIETKDQSGVAYRLLQVSNIGVGEFVETGNYRYITQETFESLRCQEVVPGHILIARMPNPTGRAWIVTTMPWRMITAVDVAILRHDSTKVDLMFLAYLLNSEHHLALVEKHTTGTTRPRISRSSLSALKIIVPSLALQAKFGTFAIGNYHLMTSLRKKNINLRAARDLLLPKLISGEIEVSNFPEPVTD